MEEEQQTDRGWAWMIMIAVMVTSFMENGVFKSFGIFFVEYVKRFDSSASVTSLISGTYFLVYSISALLMMVVGLKYLSSRQSVAIGGLFMCLGYLFSAFAENIGTVILAQGVLTGIGSAFTTCPGLVILGKYFDKRRGFVNGMALSFGSTGGLVVPPLFHFLVDKYDVSGALLVTSGLLLNILVGACLMRPIEAKTKTKESTDEDVQTFTTEGCQNHEKLAENTETKSTEGNKVMYDPLIKSPKTKNSENDEPLAMYKLRKSQSSASDDYSSLNNEDGSYKHNYTSAIAHSMENLSTSSVIPNASVNSELSMSQNIFKSDTDKLKNYSKRKRISKYFSYIFSDLVVLKNPLFILFLFTFCIGAIGCASAHVFIPPFANEMGVDSDSIAVLTIVIGGMDFFGRIVCALIADCKCIKKYQLIMVALFIVGISFQFAPLYKSFFSLVILSAIFGAFGSIMVTFYAPVLVDFIGLDGFESGLGLMTSSHGVVVAAVTPFIGFLKDVTGTYRTSFHFIGTCVLVSACLLLFVPLVKRHVRNKKESLQCK